MDTNEVTRKKLLRLQARRRGHLKEALRKHAESFAMEVWYGTKIGNSVVPLSDTNLEVEKALLYLTSGSRFGGNMLRLPVKLPKSIRKFEECGTTCCIGGLDFTRSGRRIVEQVEFYGFKSTDIYQYFHWPSRLRQEYVDARLAYPRDYKGMVEAACKAIDYFAVHE